MLPFLFSCVLAFLLPCFLASLLPFLTASLHVGLFEYWFACAVAGQLVVYLKPAADAADPERGNACSVENNLAVHAGFVYVCVCVCV